MTPNIEELICKNYSYENCSKDNEDTLNDVWKYIEQEDTKQNFPKLERLSSENFRLEILVFGKSSSLTKLHLFNLNPVQSLFFWEKLAENYPNIEFLTIENLELATLASTLNLELEFVYSH